MVQTDASAALETICSSPASQSSDKVISAAVDTVFRMDSKLANSWATSSLSKFEEETRQRIVEAVIEVAVKNGDAGAAAGWTEYLTDGERKNRALARIRSSSGASPDPEK